jgi:hypothetical protein
MIPIMTPNTTHAAPLRQMFIAPRFVSAANE